MDLKTVIYVLPLSWKISERKSDFFLFAISQLTIKFIFTAFCRLLKHAQESLILGFNGNWKMKFD